MSDSAIMISSMFSRTQILQTENRLTSSSGLLPVTVNQENLQQKLVDKIERK